MGNFCASAPRKVFFRDSKLTRRQPPDKGQLIPENLESGRFSGFSLSGVVFLSMSGIIGD